MTGPAGIPAVAADRPRRSRGCRWVARAGLYGLLAGAVFAANAAFLPVDGYLPSVTLDLSRSASGPGAAQLRASPGTWLGLAVSVPGHTVLTERVWDLDREAVERRFLQWGVPGTDVLFPPVTFTSDWTFGTHTPAPASSPAPAGTAAPADVFAVAGSASDGPDGTDGMRDAKVAARAAADASLVLLREDKVRAGLVMRDAPRHRPVAGPVFRTGPIGGMSAGTAMALATLDAATPGDLTAGRVVAVTGAVDSSGSVLPINGVEAKTELAVADHAAVFLVPDADADAARAALAALPGHPRLEIRGVGTVLEAAAVLCQPARGSDDGLCGEIRAFVS